MVLLLGAALAGFTAPARAETALEAFLEGEHLLNRGRERAAALAAFERAAALAPDFAAPHYYLTDLYSEYMDGREPDRERALTEGEAFLRSADPRNSADREAMGRTLERMVSGGDTLLISSRAPVGSPRATPAQRVAWREKQVELGGLARYGRELISAYLDAGQFDQALATCDAMLALDVPTDQRTRLRSTRLSTLIRAGRWEDELVAREQAAADRPDDVLAQRDLAEIYELMGRTRAAVKALGRLVELYPGNVDVHLRLARLYRTLRWRSLIEKQCLAALRIDPQNGQAADMLVPHGWGGLRGDWSWPRDVDAMDLAALLPALIASHHPELLARLADGYLHRGDYESAMHLARQALEMGGEPWRSVRILLSAYVESGRADDIDALVDELARRWPAQLPQFVRTWVYAIRDNKQTWPQLAGLLDSPHLVGDERVRLFRAYADRLSENDRRPEAIALLERALSPRERLLMGDGAELYQALIDYYIDAEIERQAELLRGLPLVPIVIAGLWDKPLALCQRYVDEAPFSARPYLLLAKTYRNAGRTRDTEAAYRRALELATEGWEQVETISGLTETLLGVGRAAEALDYLRDPAYLRNELYTRMTLIEALIKADQQEEANGALEETLRFLSRRSYWWGGRESQNRLLGVVKSLEGEAGAVARIQAAFDQDPTAGPLARILIDQYSGGKQFSKLAALAKEVRLSTDRGREIVEHILDPLRNAGEHERRAQVALDTILSGNVPRAYHLHWLTDLCVDACREAGTLNDIGLRVEAAFAEDPGNVALGFLLGRLYKAADRHDDAVRVYADLAARYPNDDTIVGWLLSEAAERPEHDRIVLPHLERAVAGKPQRSNLHIQLAGVLSRMQRDQEAAAHYALGFETEANPLAMHYLPDEFAVHQRLNMTADLIRRYERFIADWPDDPVGHVVVGMAYRQADRRDDAVAQLNRASELAGGRTDVRRRLSEVYRELDMPDRALAEFRTVVDTARSDHERLETMREYVQLCRDMKRYRDALAAIDDVSLEMNPEGWMAGELARLREETVRAMEAEPSAPHRLRLLVSVRRLWECQERDLAAGTTVTSQAQALLAGWVEGDPGESFSYDAILDMAASNARGDGTSVITCQAGRCQADAGGILPLPAGRASFRHIVTVDEGVATNPPEGCLATRRLAPIAGGRYRCTVTVRLPWPAKVSLAFPAGASIVDDRVAGAARDGDRFVAVINESASREFTAALNLVPDVTDYAPEVVVERISEPESVAAGKTLTEAAAELDFVRVRVVAQREFWLERYDTETRWALRMSPMVKPGR